jgi:hypothetical protein
MQDICRIVLCIYLFFGQSFVLFVVQKNADLAIEIATSQILFFMWMWMQFKLNLNILKAWIVKDTFKTKHDYRKLEAKCKTIVQAKANKEIFKFAFTLKIQALNV